MCSERLNTASFKAQSLEKIIDANTLVCVSQAAEILQMEEGPFMKIVRIRQIWSASLPEMVKRKNISEACQKLSAREIIVMRNGILLITVVAVAGPVGLNVTSYFGLTKYFSNERDNTEYCTDKPGVFDRIKPGPFSAVDDVPIN